MTAKDDRLWDNLDSDDRPWLALASEREQKEDLGSKAPFRDPT